MTYRGTTHDMTDRTRVLPSVLAIGVLLLLAAGHPFAQEPATEGVIPGQWIVTLTETANPHAQAPALTQAYGGQVRHVYGAALNGFSFQGPDAAAAAIARSPVVRSVVPNRAVQAIETVPAGVQRIDAPDTHPSYTGLGISIAILDTGILASHPDLNVRPLGANCMLDNNPAPDPGAPAYAPNFPVEGGALTWADGHGHGTHVAGTAAGTGGGGVLGVAPDAEVVAVKVLDDAGNGSWESVICGINYVTAITVGDPGFSGGPVQVANMSIAGPGSETSCTDGGLHEALCNSVATAKIVYTIGAGNSDIDAANEVPAAYGNDDGLITVSALSDYDGEPGGSGGCLVFIGLGRQCDDTFVKFSNWGSKIDVVAPGMQVYSTDVTPSGGAGYGTRSGTSMAAPHAAGVAALVLGIDAGLSPGAVEDILKKSGECPDQSQAGDDAACATHLTWTNDPDGSAEPLVNALGATLAAAGGGNNTAPTVTISVPADGSSFNQGDSVQFTGSASDAEDGDLTASLAWTSDLDGSIGSGGSVSTSTLSVGTHTITASVTDSGSLGGQDSISVTVNAVGGNIELTATVPNGRPRVQLTWTGASGANVEIKKGAETITTANDGSYQDRDVTGGVEYTYQVCEVGGSSCSTTVNVTP